ncbi:hypothetical protein JCM21714_3163 [Gracilibacillus boraciitolerans JCM 21714]|uniref:Uncharacterized protein n=1 Tax=Gracilibacillus boraciitolerans JCM 21714 TaxID=1298598 RepID=W4VMQ6_9BACI|nr:hypothetical protein [Gracilibacillus boraciitolerans]GAE94034.1 hypothetical protein JCM21714_3163 [Gracilibacillus boraciitolerans JCM 21714]
MKRKNLTLLVAVILALSALIVIVLLSINNMSTDEDVTTSSKPEDLNFADNYISYILEEEETMRFNLFGAQDVSTDGPSFLDSVDFISLNNENIDIIDYEISQGDVFDNHQLFNILIDVQLDSDELEETTKLTIHYDQLSDAVFTFGTLILKNDKGFNQLELDVTGENTLASPHPELEVNLSNQTSDTIELAKIYDLANHFVFEFEGDNQIVGNATESFNIPEFKEMEQHDFYTITPIVEYVSNDETNHYYMPGVVFGVMDTGEDKMKKILD